MLLAVALAHHHANGQSPRQLPQAPTGLMCQLLAHSELTVITTRHPQFSWIVNDSHRGAKQFAYQILVSSNQGMMQKGTGDAWDSGKVISDQSINVLYSGKPLLANSRYWWATRTWDQQGHVSKYSAPQQFNIGDLQGSPNLTSSRWTRVPGSESMAPENRHPVEQQEIKPLQLIRKAPGHYFADFGRDAFGTLRLELTSDQAGQAVEVRLGEMRGANDTVEQQPGGSVRYLKLDLPLQQGQHVYTLEIPPQKRGVGMPEHLGEVVPFRYCEIINSPSELDATKVKQLAVFTHFDATAATFTSSDATLNDVWELCKYSIKATSFLGIYVDGDRERHPYEADAYINQLGHYCVDREYMMARYSHEYLLEHPTWPTEWIMHSVLIAWADYLYTGNRDSLVQNYDLLKAKTLVALERDDGLISTQTGLATPAVMDAIRLGAKYPVGPNGFRDIVDWPGGERDGYLMQPINTVVNAFHYRALVLMSSIAEAAGKTGDAHQFNQLATRVYRSFNDKLFDTAKGIYRDGEGTDHASLHANMFALDFGLVPKEHLRTVADFIKSRGMACSVYGAQYLLEALYAAGQGDYALQLLTATNDRGWAHMLHDVGSTITLEAWDRKYKPNLDWNHAWGAAPANIIPRLLMGVEPIEPGFKKLRIRPQPGSLKQATIQVPTVRGPVRVAVRQESNGVFHLACHIPANTTAEVHLPTLSNSRIKEGGHPVKEAAGISLLRSEHGRSVLAVGAGDYAFEVH